MMWNEKEFSRLRAALLLSGTGQLLLLAVSTVSLLQASWEGFWQLWLVCCHLLLDLTAAALLSRRMGLPEEFSFLLPLAILDALALVVWQLGLDTWFVVPVLYWLGKAGYLTWLNRGTGRILWKLGRSYEAVSGMALWILYALCSLFSLLRQLTLLPALLENMAQMSETIVYAASASFLLLSAYWIRQGPLPQEDEEQK